MGDSFSKIKEERFVRKYNKRHQRHQQWQKKYESHQRKELEDCQRRDFEEKKKYYSNFKVVNRERKVDKGLNGWIYHPAVYTYRNEVTGEEKTDTGEIFHTYLFDFPK